jgi:hypothetical protein
MDNSENKEKNGNDNEKTDFQKEYDAYIQNHDPIPYKDSERVIRYDYEEYAIKKKDKNIEKIQESNEDRHGFDLKMPVFERIVCKDPETKEQSELINFLVFIFFIIMICFPALPSIGRIIYKLRLFFR